MADPDVKTLTVYQLGTGDTKFWHSLIPFAGVFSLGFGIGRPLTMATLGSPSGRYTADSLHSLFVLL